MSFQLGLAFHSAKKAEGLGPSTTTITLCSKSNNLCENKTSLNPEHYFESENPNFESSLRAGSCKIELSVLGDQKSIGTTYYSNSLSVGIYVVPNRFRSPKKLYYCT